MGNLLEGRAATNAQAPMRQNIRIPTSFLFDCSGNVLVGGVTTGTIAYICIPAGTAPDPECRLMPPKRLQTPAQDILELRFRSGLTWEELGELFGVSRRSVHNWANGEPLRQEHVALVREALRAVNQLRKSGSAETRAILLGQPPSGRGRPFDLMRARLWSEAIASAKAMPSSAIADSPRAARSHPTDYFGALTDGVGPTSGKLVRSRRLTRRSS
jgi:transcriptional regulator with XRE-family HTH domain